MFFKDMNHNLLVLLLFLHACDPNAYWVSRVPCSAGSTCHRLLMESLIPAPFGFSSKGSWGPERGPNWPRASQLVPENQTRSRAHAPNLLTVFLMLFCTQWILLKKLSSDTRTWRKTPKLTKNSKAFRGYVCREVSLPFLAPANSVPFPRRNSVSSFLPKDHLSTWGKCV